MGRDRSHPLQLLLVGRCSQKLAGWGSTLSVQECWGRACLGWATSKRAEQSSCCSCAAKPADGNIGPSMVTGARGLWDSMAQGCWASPRCPSHAGPRGGWPGGCSIPVSQVGVNLVALSQPPRSQTAVGTVHTLAEPKGMCRAVPVHAQT